MHVQVEAVVQTASDDSMELHADNGMVPVPETLSTPVISARVKYI